MRELRTHMVRFERALGGMKDLCLEIYTGVGCMLTVGVEVIRAGAPRQLGLERCIEVEYDPGDDDHVIDGDHRYNDQRTVAETWTEQDRTDTVRY